MFVYDDTSWYPEYNTSNAPLFDRSSYKKMPRKFAARKRYRRSGAGKKSIRVMRKVARREINKHLETHFQDVAQNPPVAFDYTTGHLVQLTQPTVGDTDTTRTGDKIMVKSITIRGSFNKDSTIDRQSFRMIIFKWLANDATDVPSLADICEAAAVTSAVLPFYPLKKDTAGYVFVPIYDKNFMLDTYHPAKDFHIKLYGKMLSKKPKVTPYVQYNAGAITGTGNFWMLCYSDTASITGPTITYDSRCRFTG